MALVAYGGGSSLQTDTVTTNDDGTKTVTTSNEGSSSTSSSTSSTSTDSSEEVAAAQEDFEYLLYTDQDVFGLNTEYIVHTTDVEAVENTEITGNANYTHIYTDNAEVSFDDRSDAISYLSSIEGYRDGFSFEDLDDASKQVVIDEIKENMKQMIVQDAIDEAQDDDDEWGL